MIKGVIALFTSGILANPLVLLGILFGSLFYAFLSANDIYQIYKTPAFYGLAVFISCYYILKFRRVYKENGDTDWGETLLAIICGIFKFVAASIFMIVFISFFDFSDTILTHSSDE